MSWLAGFLDATVAVHPPGPRLESTQLSFGIAAVLQVPGPGQGGVRREEGAGRGVPKTEERTEGGGHLDVSALLASAAASSVPHERPATRRLLRPQKGSNLSQEELIARQQKALQEAYQRQFLHAEALTRQPEGALPLPEARAWCQAPLSALAEAPRLYSRACRRRHACCFSAANRAHEAGGRRSADRRVRALFRCVI